MCELIRKNVVSYRCYGLGYEVRGKVGRTLYGCINVERQKEVYETRHLGLDSSLLLKR